MRPLLHPARLIPLTACIALAVTLAARSPQPVAAAGPASTSTYRVLDPIQSGDLTLFPVVRNDGRPAEGADFLTLDEGLKSGEVEVTEAGNVRGLVRSRNGAQPTTYRGDQVNTLVLVNNSKRPLLLLAGEIVTGGKQDRIIAKDRIVPAGADPIDLSVFCVEHGRWTESSAKFGAATTASGAGYMVQPEVRQQAMVAKSQQQVWNAVGGAITNMAVAAAPPAPARPRAAQPATPIAGQGEYSGVGAGAVHGSVSQSVIVSSAADIATVSDEAVRTRSLGTTSYAKAMQNTAVSAKVDEESANMVQSREQVLAKLRAEHAVGVVVALRGEIIWADLFSSPELLTRYWIKLVRSYAAEGLTPNPHPTHKPATLADAQAFLDTPAHGREDSEGEVGVYRYREVKTPATDLFALESLLPNTNFDVHISKLKLKNPQLSSVSPIPVF